MAARLDGDTHKLYQHCLDQISKVTTKDKGSIKYKATAGSRDDAVRARHKHQAVAKLLEKDGYTVSFFPEGDTMPTGRYVSLMEIGMDVSWGKSKDAKDTKG